MMEELLKKHRPLLGILVSVEPVSIEDPFWLELLSFAAPLSAFSPAAVRDAIQPYCQQLAVNNKVTCHYSCLLYHVVDQLKGALAPRVTPELQLQLCNSVLFLNALTVQLCAILSADEVHALFVSPARSLLQQDLPEQLVQACLQYIRDAAITPRTYVLYLAVTQTLIALCASQLYTCGDGVARVQHAALEALHSARRVAAPVVQRLLTLFVQRPPLASSIPLWLPPAGGGGGDDGGGALVTSIAEAAVSVVMLPLRAAAKLFPAAGTYDPRSPIADCALWLLLLLLHYAPPPHSQAANAYKLALQDMRNTDAAGATLEDAEAGAASTSTRVGVAFSQLFDSVCAAVERSDAAVLLLYNLLNKCPAFLDGVLVRSDIDSLLLPLLAKLYRATPRTPHQLYMLQIIILILSQDAGLSKSLHKLTVARVPWYAERALVHVSLGSLLITVLLRMAHRNLHGSQDLYLHTNTLAALANLAPHVAALNSHAVQRLSLLLDSLHKRHLRLRSPPKRSEGAPAADGANEAEQQLIDDFLRTIIEIMDTMVSHALPKNPELVYALLHRQEVLQRLAEEAGWRPLLENLLAVVAFFNARIDDVAGSGGAPGTPAAALSVSTVLGIIETHLRAWRPNQLKPVAELKFTYEEAAGSEDFFVPYVWSLVSASPWLTFPASPFAQPQPQPATAGR